MSQSIAQEELVQIPSRHTTLVARMSWALPGEVSPDLWAVAHQKHHGPIQHLHAHGRFLKTRSGEIQLDPREQTATVDLTKLPSEADQVAFIASLYFGPQSGHLTFAALDYAEIQLDALARFGKSTPLAKHVIQYGHNQFLPFGSLVRDQHDHSQWYFAPEYSYITS